MSSEATIKYSIVVPFFNEQENIPPLYMKLTEVMDSIGEPYELVFVDDGSRDSTFRVLSDIFEHDRRVNLIRLRQVRTLIRRVREASRGDLSMEWLLPLMTRQKLYLKAIHLDPNYQPAKDGLSRTGGNAS